MKKTLSKIVEILLACMFIVIVVSYIGIITIGYLENVYTIWHIIAIYAFASITTLIIVIYTVSSILEWRNGKKEK